MKLIDEKIRALTYNESTLLAQDELGKDSYTPIETRQESEQYIVVKRTQRSMEAGSYDMGIVDSVVDRTFPGSLIKINKRLTDNNPDVLVTDRKPMKFRIDIPGMGADAEFILSDPTYINVSTGIDNTLKKYAGQTLPTRITFKGEMAYSESQINAVFGLEMKNVSKQLNINFNSIMESKTSVYIASFRQIFYSVSADMPKNPSDVFADSVTWESLQSRGINNANPPGLVNKVGYGRAVYVKIESSEQSTLIEAALKASINENLETTSEASYKEVLNKSSFTAVVVGGSTKEHSKIISCDSIAEVIKIIEDNSEYSIKNPGYPIYYNAVFLKDNQNAKTMSLAQYIETTSETYKNGLIKIIHTGGYVAQFNIKWDEILYNADGSQSIAQRSWSENDKDLTANYTTEIALTGNCKNISVKAWGCTGLAWDWWRLIFERTGLSLSPTMEFNIYGSSLNQKYTITQ